MDWAELKTSARHVVHNVLSRAAVYEAPDGSEPVAIRARLVINNKMIGDLDREGYGRVSEGITQIVIDNDEIPSPVVNSTVTFENGDAYALVVPLTHDKLGTRSFEASKVLA